MERDDYLHKTVVAMFKSALECPNNNWTIKRMAASSFQQPTIQPARPQTRGFGKYLRMESVQLKVGMWQDYGSNDRTSSAKIKILGNLKFLHKY